MKLNVRAFAAACAIVWGAALFLAAWWVMLWGAEGESAGFVGAVYRGYAFTPLGSVIGLLWGVADGLIGGLVFAWLYNVMASCCTCAERDAQPEPPREA